MACTALLLAFALPATATSRGLSAADLSAVSAAPPPAARLDLGLTVRDTDGRSRTIGEILDAKPAFLVFVDYTCTTLCGADLMLLANAIMRARLQPTSFRLLVMGIDPRDTEASARKMESSEIPAELLTAASFLLPDQATVDRVTSALGYRFAYDRDADQFAHPAAIYVIGVDGVVASVLSPFSLTVGDMREVLTAAAPAGLYQRIRLLCYAYDPATGAYALRIGLMLRIAAVATVLGLGGGILALTRAGKRAA